MFGFMSKKELKRQAEERKEREEKRIQQENDIKNKIHTIANWLVKNNINFSDVINACQFINEYEQNINKYNNAKKKAVKHSNYSSGTGDSILLGLVGTALDGAEELSNKAKVSKIEKEKLEYIESNKDKIQECNKFINLLPAETSIYCEKYSSEIMESMNSIKHEEEEKIKEQERLEIEKQKEAERLRIEKLQQDKENDKKTIAEESRLRKEQEDRGQKIKECSKAIKEIENFTLAFQKSISKDKSLSIEHLNLLETKLDILEDQKDYIPESDINNIERCQRKLSFILDKCENKETIQVDIDIIKESFEKILAK